MSNVAPQAVESFRYMAFLVYYRRLGGECSDPTVRFVTALVKSAQPIPAGKQSLIVKWWKERRSKDDDGAEQPRGERGEVL